MSDSGRGDGDDGEGGDARARRSASTRKGGGDESRQSGSDAKTNTRADGRKSDSGSNNPHRARTDRPNKSEYKPGDQINDIDTLLQAVSVCAPGEVARVLQHSQFRPGAPAFTTLIKTCGRAGGWDKAVELYQAMKQRGVAANTITCSALINACGKSKQWEKALEIFREMKADGVEANIFTYSALISACAKGRQLDKALEIFRECQAAGVEPDAITYGAVISACEKGRRCDDALDVYKQMRRAGVDANVITCNSVLAACDKAGRCDDALAVFESMRDEGIKPDKHSYAAVIGACAAGGKVDEAMRLYRAGTKAVDPDIGMYTAAMQACAAANGSNGTVDGSNGPKGSKRGAAVDAATIWREMRERLPEQTPGAGVAAACIAACEASGSFRSMLDVVGAEPCSPTQARKDRDAEEAANAAAASAEAEVARAKVAPPPVLTAAAILSGRTAASDAAAAAEATLASATRDARTAALTTRAKGVRTDLPTASYASLMAACERGGLSSRAVEVFAAARAAVPSAGTTAVSADPSWYERALRAAAAGGLGEPAAEILRSMSRDVPGGATGAARASALQACLNSPAGSLGCTKGPRVAAQVWATIKSAVEHRARADGKSDVRPAVQACRASAVCAAKEGDAKLAADVLGTVSSVDDETARDASVLVACAAAFAVAGDASRAAETLGKNADASSLVAALAKTAVAGANKAALAVLADDGCVAKLGGVGDGTCAAAAACGEGRGGDIDAALALLKGWGENHESASLAAKKLEDGKEAAAATAVAAPDAAPGSPPVDAGSPAVKQGTSFAFAAGARSKPVTQPATENGEDGSARRVKGSANGEKRNANASQGKKRVDSEGKKGTKRGVGGTNNKGPGTKGWNAAPAKPLIASSVSFVPASAVKAAPFVPLSKRDSGGAAELAAAAAKLSVKAPAFTPRAAAPEFVPKSKD